MTKEDEHMQDLQEQLLSKYQITVSSYQDNNIDDVSSFLKKIDEIISEKEGSIIQLVDSDYICGKSHLNQAISQAIKAFDEKQNFAKDKGLEICVRLSAQKQISEALKLFGIKKQGNITAIYINTTENQVKDVEKLLSERNDELLEQYDSEKIVERYNLDNEENLVDNINEKIALLAIKN